MWTSHTPLAHTCLVNELVQPPEAELVERLRTAVRPKLSMREAAKRADISDSRWRQISKGFRQETKDVRVPVRAPAVTLARMMHVVGGTPAQLREVGRDDAADELEGQLTIRERNTLEKAGYVFQVPLAAGRRLAALIPTGPLKGPDDRTYDVPAAAIDKLDQHQTAISASLRGALRDLEARDIDGATGSIRSAQYASAALVADLIRIRTGDTDAVEEATESRAQGEAGEGEKIDDNVTALIPADQGSGFDRRPEWGKAGPPPSVEEAAAASRRDKPADHDEDPYK